MAWPVNARQRATACFAIAIAFALAPFLFPGDSGPSSRWILFLGGFHPMVLHLPIGILIAIAAFEAWGLTRRKNEPALRCLLWLAAAVSASLAVVTGYTLATGGGHDPALLRPHLWLGASFTALCWCVLGTLQLRDVVLVRLAGWASAALPMLAAGHLGGVMVHGSPFVNAPWRPDPTAIEILPSLGENIGVYTDLVHPILTAKCQSCHGPGKQSGRLRLDSLGAALAGGSHGPALFPGRSRDSRMLQAILLPIDDDKHMPPKSRPQLSQAEIDLLHWWIETGASDQMRVAATDAPDVIAPFLVPEYRLLPDPQLLARQERQAEEARQDLAKRRAALEASLAEVPPAQRAWLTFTSQSSADLELVVATSPEAFDDEQLAALGTLLRACVRITLANTRITDDGLAALSLPAVRELNLRGTQVTNRGVQALAGASNLELLNLYGTAVDDGLVDTLPPLPALRRLFLGETPVSHEALAQLRKTHPRAEIISSLSVSREIADAVSPPPGRRP
jgi:mono/diheme cytochrome c family protein